LRAGCGSARDGLSEGAPATLAALRHDPLPTPAEALGEPLRTFPSWFLRVECKRCGKVVTVNESHARWRDRTLADILRRMRHDGCGGLPGRVELLTGIQGASSRPVRRIVLREAEGA
jgi:hypothetical protein